MGVLFCNTIGCKAQEGYREYLVGGMSSIFFPFPYPFSSLPPSGYEYDMYLVSHCRVLND